MALKFNFFKPPAISRNLKHPFDLDYPIFQFSPTDVFTVGQSHENVHVFGQVGSGKTSGSGRALFRAYLRAGYGGCIYTVKTNEFARIFKDVEACGRLHDLIRFSPDEFDAQGRIRWRLNFLAYEQLRPQRGGGLTRNLVRLITGVQEMLERAASRHGSDNAYFKLAGPQLIANALDLYRLARPGVPVTIHALYDIILSAPRGWEEVYSEAWLKDSLCNRLLDEGMARRDQMSPREQKDFDLIGKFFFREWPDLAQETRSSIVSTVTTTLDIFMRGNMAEMFCTGTTIVPEVTHEGAIVVVDIPVKSYGYEGLCAQTIIKSIFEQAAERRDVSRNRRSVFVLMDEAHLLVNEPTVSFCTTARESLTANLLLSQSLSNYYWALGGEDKGKSLTDSLMNVMGTKIFHASSDPVLNKFAADCFAQSWQGKSNVGRSESDSAGRGGVNVGFSETLAHNVQPEEFLKLRKGGKENNYWVDAIIGQGGRIWNASGRTYLRTSFNQKGE